MLRKALGLFCALTLSSVALAADVDVSNPAALRQALLDAQANRESDVINVLPCSGAGCITLNMQSVYNITSPLTYTAIPEDGFSLTIDGFDSDTRILSGGAASAILQIDTTGANSDAAAAIFVKGLTIVQGNSMATPNDGGAVYILVNDASVEVSGSVFAANNADGDGGAVFIRAQG